MANGMWTPHGGGRGCFNYNCAFVLQCIDGYRLTSDTDVVAACSENSTWLKTYGSCQGKPI